MAKAEGNGNLILWNNVFAVADSSNRQDPQRRWWRVRPFTAWPWPQRRHTNPSPHFWSAKYDLHDSSLLNFCMNSMIVSVFAMVILV